MEAASPSVSVDERRALARMVMQAFENWGLETHESLAMLGLGREDAKRLVSYRKGAPLADDPEVLDRAGHILGMHKDLRLLFPHDRENAYRWMKAHNRAFDGRTPAEVVSAEGLQGLLRIRGYLGRAVA